MDHNPLFERIPCDMAFFATPPHACSYLGGHQAITLFADPHMTMDTALYSALADLGFRRSGGHVYRPRCPNCQECLPVRIPVDAFQPDRSQRRTWARNQDLTVSVQPATFSEENYRLYRRYITSRHADGSMDIDDPEQYLSFLTSHWSDTHFVEFREQGRLLAVAVIDILEQGLSAVYTFFDPNERSRGLGTLAVLWQVEEVRRRALPWVYLGYLIESSPKMVYKTRFRPLQTFIQGRWQGWPMDGA
jgi:arginine-tRNA-protein transferase